MKTPVFILLVLAIVVIILTLAASSTQAQSQTVEITVRMANSAPGATVTVNGCNPSPLTFTSGTGTVPVQMTAKCYFYLSFANSGNTRNIFGDSGLATSNSYNSSIGAVAITAYEQVSNSFMVTPLAQPTFDGGLVFSITGSYLGSPSIICKISPASGGGATSCTGVWSDYGVVVTFPEMPSGAADNSRWENSFGAASSTAELNAGGGNYNNNYYKQWATVFQAVAEAQSAFDSGLSTSVQANSLGTFATVCTITPPGGQGTSGCSGYVDNDAAASFARQMSGAAADTQWVCSYPCDTSAIASGGEILQMFYFKQVSEKFAYSVSGGGTGFSAPSLSCTQYGTAGVCVTLSTSTLSLWLDYGSAWSVTNPLPGSTSGERWSSNDTSGTAAAGSSVTLQFFHQYSISVDYTVSGGGTPASTPSITYNLYGASATSQISQSPASIWMDVGQSFTVPQILGAAGERWASPISSYPVSSGETYLITLYNQYSFELSYMISGGGASYSPPDFSFTNFTESISVPLSQTQSQYWANKETQWNVTDPLVGSNSGERWETSQTTSGVVSSSVTEDLTYFHQYFVTFASSVVGGGVGYSLSTVSVLQSGQKTNLTQGWADAGSRYSYTNPLTGSDFNERWYTGTPNGTISGAVTFNATYYHQYAFVLSYIVIPSGSGYDTPIISFTFLASPAGRLLSTSPSTVWVDSGTKWSTETILGGSGQTSRWATDRVTSGIAATPYSEELDYYLQFCSNFTYSVEFGGSPPPPLVNFTSFGGSNHTLLAVGSSEVWADSGSSWDYPVLLPSSGSEERWIASSAVSGTVDTPTSYRVSYLHQYFLRDRSNTSVGGTFLNSTKWYDNGDQASLNATAYAGWKFIFWNGVGPGSYNGTLGALSFPLSGPANETAVFYPGITMISSGGGAIVYEVGSLTGNVTGSQVVYLPLGENVSLKATPAAFDYIFVDWSQSVTGTSPQTFIVPRSPESVTANFALDYSDITMVGMAIPIVIVLAVYILVVRRWSRSQNSTVKSTPTSKNLS